MVTYFSVKYLSIPRKWEQIRFLDIAYQYSLRKHGRNALVILQLFFCEMYLNPRTSEMTFFSGGNISQLITRLTIPKDLRKFTPTRLFPDVLNEYSYSLSVCDTHHCNQKTPTSQQPLWTNLLHPLITSSMLAVISVSQTLAINSFLILKSHLI